MQGSGRWILWTTRWQICERTPALRRVSLLFAMFQEQRREYELSDPDAIKKYVLPVAQSLKQAPSSPAWGVRAHPDLSKA